MSSLAIYMVENWTLTEVLSHVLLSIDHVHFLHNVSDVNNFK